MDEPSRSMRRAMISLSENTYTLAKRFSTSFSAVCIAIPAGTRASSEITARRRAIFPSRGALISRLLRVGRVIAKYLKLVQNVSDRLYLGS